MFFKLDVNQQNSIRRTIKRIGDRDPKITMEYANTEDIGMNTIILYSNHNEVSYDTYLVLFIGNNYLQKSTKQQLTGRRELQLQSTLLACVCRSFGICCCF